MVFADPVGAVRTAVAGVIATLAETVFKVNNQWNELFSLLTQLVADADASKKSLTFNLIAQLAEHIPSHLLPHTATLCQMVIIHIHIHIYIYIYIYIYPFNVKYVFMYVYMFFCPCSL